MLAIERRREILARLSSDGKVIVAELAKDFGVTEETVRRDLEKLDAEGLASKIYGGAVSRKNSALDLPYNVRVAVNVEEKERISDVLEDWHITRLGKGECIVHSVGDDPYRFRFPNR